MKLAALIFAALTARAATFTIEPPVITSCVNGHGRATLNWSGVAAPSQVRLSELTGVEVSGYDGPSGTASTGDWITDGMVFVLVNQRGVVEGSVVAQVRCGGVNPDLELALRNGSFYPLQVGNTWVYRVSHRQVTSDYVVHSITGTTQVDGKSYFVLTETRNEGSTAINRLRAEDSGRVYYLPFDSSLPERLLLDPSMLNRGPYTGPVGNFTDSGSQVTTETLFRVARTWVRGLGLVSSATFLTTGSSGGFSDSLDLVEVRLANGVHLSQSVPSIRVALENTLLNVSGKLVSDCRIPCYSVACFGGDAPGTYRPCVQARVEGRAPGAYTLELELANAKGEVVFRTQPSQPVTGDLLRYVQVQLYAQPGFTPLPAGQYKLVTRLKSSADVLATAEISARIE